MDSKALGEYGEKIAREYLIKKGYKILVTNFKQKFGEIDIIGKKQKEIIFFEVKTTKEKSRFLAEDKITLKKKRNLIKTALIFLSQHKIPLDSRWQIDVLTIRINLSNNKFQIKHFENAVENIL